MMLDYGLVPFGEIGDPAEADETAYKSEDGSIYIELHSTRICSLICTILTILATTISPMLG